MALGSRRCPRSRRQTVGTHEDLSPGLCILAAPELPATTRIELQVRLLRLSMTTGQRGPTWWQEAALSEAGWGEGSRGRAERPGVTSGTPGGPGLGRRGRGPVGAQHLALSSTGRWLSFLEQPDPGGALSSLRVEDPGEASRRERQAGGQPPSAIAEPASHGRGAEAVALRAVGPALRLTEAA